MKIALKKEDNRFVAEGKIAVFLLKQLKAIPNMSFAFKINGKDKTTAKISISEGDIQTMIDNISVAEMILITNENKKKGEINNDKR